MSAPTAEAPFKIVEAVSSVDLGRRQATVVIEGNDIAAIANLDATNAALQFASERGLIGAAVRDRGNPYTVDKDGNQLTDPSKGFPQGGKFRLDMRIGSTL